MSGSANGPLLRVVGVTRSFGGLRALSEVSLVIERGEVVGLIGSNGAGKTTLLHVLYGQVRPDAGRIWFDDIDVTRWPPRRRARQGMGLVFQQTNIFAELSVEENLRLGAMAKTRQWQPNRSRVSSRSELAAVDEMLSTIDLEAERYLPASELSHGQQQWLEIGLVLLSKPRLLLLDEPTSGMTRQESMRTAGLLRHLRDSGVTEAMLVVEHNIEFMKTISDRVTVMHRGEVLADGSLAEVQGNQAVRDSYLGRLA